MIDNAGLSGTAETAPATAETPDAEPAADDDLEEFDLDDIEVIESKVFG